MSSQRITVLMVNEYPDYIDAQIWADGLKRRVPGLEFRLWPDAGSKDDIDIVLIDKGAKPGFFDAMSRLRAVIYLGAGVDGIDLDSFPRNVPLIRLATREQTSEVVQYIVLQPGNPAFRRPSRNRCCTAGSKSGWMLAQRLTENSGCLSRTILA